jgi:hypothetical protein
MAPLGRAVDTMIVFFSAMVLGGSIVYLANDQAGSILIAAGCALAVVWWFYKLFQGRSKSDPL